MKAIQVEKPNSISIIEKAMPAALKENDVLVKTKAAGICHSDIMIYKGQSPFASYPRIIGHEIVGEVVQIGDKVDTLSVGMRVVLEPISYCGKCYACRMGRPNVCQNLIVSGVNIDGGFQEYFSVPAKQLHHFPDSIDWESAVMIEPFTIGAQAVSRGGVAEGDLVMIYGAGPTGLAVLENALYAKATCIVVDIKDERLEFAKEFGAHYVINSAKTDLRQEIEKISNGMMCNVIIDAVGLPAIIEEAVTLASTAGRIVNLGFRDENAKISLRDITRSELTILGSRLQNNQFKKCVEIFSNKQINLTKLITHTFPFEEIGDAFELIDKHPEKTGKVILTFDKRQ